MNTAVTMFRVDYPDSPSNDVVPQEIVKAIEEVLAKHGGGTTKVFKIGVSGKKL